MPSQKNVQLLQVANDKVGRANAIFFADYQTITHKDLEGLRNKLCDINAELSILKNNLTHIALKEQKQIDVEEQLQGPLAAFFSYEDPVKTAKTLYDFFKPIDTARIKFGIFEGNVIDGKMITSLASLPPKEILLAKLLGLLQSPIRGLMYAMNYNTTQLALTLKEIEKQKGASSA